MRCGILFNGNQNLFKPYLEWILDSTNNSDNIKISGIHTNNINLFNSNFLEYGVELNGDINDLLDKSDVVFSLGYWKILKNYQIKKVKLGIVNFHHSYRLKYKGRHCGTWAIRNGEKYHGSTIHFIDENVDRGQIIDTERFEIENHHTSEDLFLIANKIGLKLLKKNFYKIIQGEISSFIDEDSDCFVYREKQMSHEIDFRNIKDKNDLLREIRSLTFSEKPAPYMIISGQKIYLKHENHDSGILGKHKNERKD